MAELPGVFRRGTEFSGSCRRLFEDPFEECTYRLRRLDDFAAKLAKEGWHDSESERSAPAAKHHWQDSDSAFLRAVPDKGLELHNVWKAAWEFCQDASKSADEEVVRRTALQAICRRFSVADGWLRQRLADLRPQCKDLVIFLPVLRAELDKLKAVLTAVAAGSSGAEALTAKAVAARGQAEARCAAAAANVKSLAQRGPRHPVQRPNRATATDSLHSPTATAASPSSPQASSPPPPVQPPSSAVEGIQRWVESVRQTGAVAASSNDRDWRRQLDLLRAGLTGTAVCLSPEKGSKLPSLPSLPSLRRNSSPNLEECPICLEPLRPHKQSLIPLVPLPCGHSFHAACACRPQFMAEQPWPGVGGWGILSWWFQNHLFHSDGRTGGVILHKASLVCAIYENSSVARSQWLQKCPRCPMCRHSPFVPMPSEDASSSPSHPNLLREAMQGLS